MFGAEALLELIGGEVYEKMPMNSPHASGVSAVEEALRVILPIGQYIRTQSALTAGDDSQPLPDVAVVQGAWRDYTQHHPVTATLIVEVSDTTLASDRALKGGLYARAAVPEYWILNLRERALEVYRDPIAAAGQPFGHAYRIAIRCFEADAVSPLFAPNSAIRISDILP